MRHYVILFGPFAQENRKIQTIKDIRSALDCGLVASKYLVEAAWNEPAAYIISAEQLGNLYAVACSSSVLKDNFNIYREYSSATEFKSVTPYNMSFLDS